MKVCQHCQNLNGDAQQFCVVCNRFLTSAPTPNPTSPSPTPPTGPGGPPVVPRATPAPLAPPAPASTPLAPPAPRATSAAAPAASAPPPDRVTRADSQPVLHMAGGRLRARPPAESATSASPLSPTPSPTSPSPTLPSPTPPSPTLPSPTPPHRTVSKPPRPAATAPTDPKTPPEHHQPWAPDFSDPVADTSAAHQCANCGRSLADGQIFCRCGHENEPAPPPPAEPANQDPAPKAGLALGRDRAFRRAMRVANDGTRPRFNEKLANRTRLVRGTVIVAVLAIAVSQYGSLGVRSRRWGITHVPLVSKLLYSPVPTAAYNQLHGTAVSAPVMLKSGKPWTTSWTQTSSGSSDCSGIIRSTAAFSVTFTGRYNVDLISVKSGPGAHAVTAPNEYRPKTLAIQFSDGTCDILGLSSSNGTQRFQVSRANGRQATGAAVAILDAYPPTGTSNNHASLSALTFYSFK